MTKSRSNATAPNAKGTLVVGSGTDASTTLAVGTNNYVLTADSAEASGVKWAAAGGGKVLQVVSATSTTSTGTSSTSYVDSNLSASITPSSASSKVLILTSQPLHFQSNRGTYAYSSIRLMRGATAISTQLNSFGIEAANSSRGVIGNWSWTAFAYLDSPNTTSSTTYKTQINVDNATDTVTAQESSKPSSIVLIEIGA